MPIFELPRYLGEGDGYFFTLQLQDFEWKVPTIDPPGDRSHKKIDLFDL